MAHRAAPCIMGASAKKVMGGACGTVAASASTLSKGGHRRYMPPPPSAPMNRFLCGHITPLGKPVVPPVHSKDMSISLRCGSASSVAPATGRRA